MPVARGRRWSPGTCSGEALRGSGSVMIGAMRRSSFSPISLLRYAGLITYACVGVPLVQRDWMLSSLSEPRTPVHVARALHAQNHNDILLWAVSYALFGVVYWLLTRNLDSRRYWGVRLLGLLVLTCAALSICWFSASGVGALLLMVVGLVLPWLLPLPVATRSEERRVGK